MGNALRLVAHQISVGIVSDDAIARQGMTALFAQETDLAIVASVERFEQLGDAEPDVILVDAQFVGDGSPLANTLAELGGECRIVAMGVACDHPDLASLVRAGVAGFVIRHAVFDELASTIRVVAEGGRVMPPSLLDSLVRRVADGEGNRTLPVCSAFERMTAREREITLLIACGKSNKEIASHTGVSSHTVKTHVRNIMGKLGLHTRLQIAARANVEGWQELSGTEPAALAETVTRPSISPAVASSVGRVAFG